MDLVCEECGETNRAGTEFCVFCGHFLAWGSDAGGAPSLPTPPAPPAPEPSLPPADAPDWRPPGRTTTVTDASPPTQELPSYRPSAAPAASVPVGSPALALQQNCPRCGRANDASRRFCAKCGHQLIASPGRPLGRTVSTSRAHRWWERYWDTKDRSARRAYRRSLPPLLRWRRVLLAGVLALVLIGGTAVVFKQGPDDLARSAVDQWYELRNRKRFVVVQGVTATMEQPMTGVDAARLVDGSRDAWTSPWSGEEGTGCDPPPGTSAVVLSFPATRIHRMDFYAGLSEKLSDRFQQFRPKKLAIRFDDDPSCQSVEFREDKYEQADRLVDSGKPVTSMRIAVQTAYLPIGETRQDQLSIGEITLETHPRKFF